MGCDFTTLPHKGIQALSPYVPGKSIEEVAQEFEIGDIIKLASNENALGCSPKIMEVFQHMDTNLIARYPMSAHHPLRQQLSHFLQVDPNMLTIANGSDSLFGLLLICFALHHNKSMLTHDYAFSSYAIQAHILGVEVVSAPTQEYQVDVAALLTACSPKTALIFIANPNNPTGLMLSLPEIERILNNILDTTLLVLDEAYYEFLPPNSLPTLPLLKRYRNLVITRTFSKAYGLAGLRLGYAIADPQITALIQKIHLPFTANIIAMHAACAALEDQDFVQRTQQYITHERQLMAKQLDAHHVRYLPSSANFITLDCAQDGAIIAKKLEKRGIIVRPLHPYGMSSFLRVTIGTAAQNERFLREYFNITR